MVGQLKEDVAEWYQGLSAHKRIEAMCTLIDLSLPFEIRFLGSLIEHLGRKDFSSFRDAESKANSFANGNPDDKKKLLQSLAEVTPLCVGNGTQFVNPLIHPNSFNDSPANRPSPTHVSDSKGRQPQADSDNQNDHVGCGEPVNSHDTLGPKGSTKGVSAASNHVGFSSEEETESMCITNDLKRRKLTLYISVLSPTNHDGANLYYSILSDIDDNPALTWMEDLDKDAQEEVSLLYTLASRHPAFTFEQRMFLGAVANRVSEIIGSKFPVRSSTTLQQQHPQSLNSNPGTHPIYYNHTAIPHAMDPKYGGGYYIFAHPPMHIQQSPHQPSSVPSNGEQIRNPPVATPYPAYSFGPYFVPHHPAAISHPTPLNSPYAQNNIMTSSLPTASIVTGSGQSLQQPTPVAPANSSTAIQGNNVALNNAHQMPSPSSKIQNSQSQPSITSSTASNSMSQHSCLSTPSRTPSVPYQSEQNSVNGDSEESSENCNWDSPESSPFQSPSQSLTPSRSQSPPSGIPNSSLVQTVSLSGHGSSTFVVTSGVNSITYGGSVNNVSSSNGSSSSTNTKTEKHTSSGLVIPTPTSSSTSCLTSSSNAGGIASGNGPTSNANNSSSNNSGNNYNLNKTSSASVAATANHTQLSPHCHLPNQSTQSVRGPSKNASSVPISSNNQSFSNHPSNSVVVPTSVISVSQQPQTLPQSMMGPTVPVHMQQTSTLTSSNNVGGITSHSMSSAIPPMTVAYAQQSHGAHNNLGQNTGSHPPPSQNSFHCYPHMNSSVSFYRAAAAAQGQLTRNQYIQPHPVIPATNPLHNNQLGIKGPDLQRGGHNIHNSLRQKPQLQNTPKRRGNNVNSSGLVNNMPVIGGGPAPLANNSQSTSGKGDEVCDLKDSRSSEIVVSANPSNNKGSLQQQERTSVGGNKPYHHNVSNGLVNAHPGSSVGALNPLPNQNVIPSNNSTGIPNPLPQASVSNAGGPIIPTIPSKLVEDGLLGDGVAGIDGYTITQIPYHGPQVYGHPGGPFMIPNGYMTSSYYNPAMGAVAAAAMGAGGPPQPPSTEIMMNPSCVPHFSFPFTIPHSFSSLPSAAGSKGISNAKDKANSLHGNSSNPSGSTDSASKSVSSNPHENQNHVTVAPASHSSGYYRTPSQPSRNNRGVILDIGGGALGNSSLSPVNVDVAVIPPLDDFGDAIHRPRKISCYNCGSDTHLGPDCKDGSMEEMTRHQFRVNYSGPSSVTADGKDGD